MTSSRLLIVLLKVREIEDDVAAEEGHSSLASRLPAFQISPQQKVLRWSHSLGMTLQGTCCESLLPTIQRNIVKGLCVV